MRQLVKPRRLKPGDTIATISPCNGWAGDEGIKWKSESYGRSFPESIFAKFL
ncbi:MULTISPECIES: hypothetical protein [Butyrivibrio]|uniref:hypothetical protein n=1 Tax=Butyrivibrio TaxID=830 RepID=UPI000425568A|nr:MULTISPECIES: hypothetical protein [Butyrivibrio]